MTKTTKKQERREPPRDRRRANRAPVGGRYAEVGDAPRRIPRPIAVLASGVMLVGCAGLDVSTPFGSAKVPLPPPPPPMASPVEARQVQSRVDEIGVEETTRRVNDTNNCILMRTVMGVDPCLCYTVYRTPPGRECVAPARVSYGTTPAPLPTTISASPDDDPAEREWKERTKEWEDFVPRLTDGHIGYGHSCRANNDCAEYEGVTLTRVEADELFAKDWKAAGDRAYANLDTRDPKVVSACFRYGCNNMTMDSLRARLATGDARDKLTLEAMDQ